MNQGLLQYGCYFETLRENILFADLPNDSLKTLLEISKNQIWPKKTCILDSDHTLHRFYIVISGKIKEYQYEINQNKELIQNILIKNDFFNICTLLKGHASRLFYEVLSSSELIYISMEDMRLWMDENPKIIGPIVNYLVKKTEKLEDRVFDLCSMDTSSRLAKLLIENFNIKTNKIELINGLSNSILAGLIGTTRAVLNRHLQDFKAIGILNIEGGNIEMINLPLLFHKLQVLSEKPPHEKEFLPNLS
ncbi:Crp/Fnr family transcriptional regulator [Arenibacter echinorum]|uniref:CRP/FNR family transcriptional regulator n=1 Tax=Arenibacter echinorum TaxID=440515 RepID=A0A327RAV9_9FLAO|nr:Crp/Fnr family transcriptional regulator [Arenibacter echinorum]RAJ12613.1 CRP/FNR family transcriptional regulator [Arenibacter echinorum]